MKPLLSIAMIVKNEIRCVERCLKALQPLRERIPCELVIADTGSDDGTREVVQRYADICFDFAWVNDFSAARNAVLDRCTGEWVLSVDADEYLEPDFDELVGFLTDSERDRYDWGYVQIVNYRSFDMQGSGAGFMALRMAKLSNHPRYEGAVHETFDELIKGENKYLLGVRFKHDGYVADGGHNDEKGRRNAALLEKELKKWPEDIRLLLQMIQATSYDPPTQIEYTRRTMKLLSRNRHRYDAPQAFLAAVCTTAIAVATTQNLPELEQWEKLCDKWYPDSLQIHMNVKYMVMQHYYKEKQYDRVPERVETYLRAWRKYQARDFDPEEIVYSVVSAGGRDSELEARACACDALGRLGRSAEAAEMLRGEDGWDEGSAKACCELLKAAVWSSEEEQMQRAVAEALRRLRARAEREDAAVWETVCETASLLCDADRLDQAAPKQAWRLFRCADGVLGQAAQLMEAERGAMPALLDAVEDWAHLPARVIDRAVALGTALPSGFYRQSKARLERLAERLCGVLPAKTVLDWLAQGDFTGSLACCQFAFLLYAALMQNAALWQDGADEGRGLKAALCRGFADAAEDLLFNLYSGALLEDEDEWCALPSLHTFALYLLRGRAAKQQGDEVGYLRALHAALLAEGSMKGAVQHLLRRPAWKPPVSPELAALAEKVREILAQYPADDPAVQQLKNSPVYQQVAQLIED